MPFLTVIPELSIWDLLSVIGLDDFDHHSQIWVFFISYYVPFYKTSGG